ncbi:MFS transporter [Latilactobacillus fuchuensis]|uniref:Sugar transporter n=1 Tax=Latilactobacillus fuchuensis DSM 14340 = JCM 11249 TaxID=1423747 RepID=A0A0R1RV01_9LACO|nr:MFS transporter [Latilactobacillus fuchuensis]KRL60959.1 sugar transporter [Latilactobacillus fuchuensis DSM 14340 = JCM 11249]
MNNTVAPKMSRDQILLVIVAGIASYLDASILVSCGVALPLWTNYFAFSPLISGSINTALTLAVAIGAVSGGALSDKFGRVAIFNFDILVVAVGTAIIAFTDNIILLFIGLALAGWGSGADLPTSLAVISERMDKANYGKAITSTQLYWTVGIILSQFIGFLTADMAGIIPVKFLFGFISLMAFINWGVRIFSKSFKNIETGLADEVQSSEGTEAIAEAKPKLGELLKQKSVLVPLVLLTLFYLFWNLPANSFGMFLNYFLVIVDHQAAATATIIAMAGNILGFVATLIFMKAADTKYRYHIMFIGLAMGIVAMFIAGLSASYWFIFSVCYIVYMFGYIWIGEPIYKVWTQSFYPVNARASMTGFSLGIVRALTAAFALITPTLMAISPALFLWILFGCVIIYGIFAIAIVKIIPKYHIHDTALEQLHAAKIAKK